MDESKRCEDCEWWDDRLRGDDPSAADQMPCLRWVQYDLWKSAEERCWQWTGRSVNEFSERQDQLEHVGRRLHEARRLLQKAVRYTDVFDSLWAEEVQIWLQGE